MDVPDEINLPEPNYYAEAFKSGYNLAFLAGFGLMGFAFSGFWYLGAAVEMLYLGFVANNPRFQRMVRAEKNHGIGIDWKQRENELYERLPAKDQSRYDRARKTCRKIEERAAAVDPSSSILFEQNLAKLGYLQSSFLKMLSSLILLREYLAETDPRQLVKTIERLKSEAATASEKVREVKQQNVQILEQRLEQLKKASEQQEFLEASLATIEDTLGLIGDNVMTLNNPAGISDQIDLVVTNMKENEQILGEMQSLMSGVSGAAVASLPAGAGDDEDGEAETEESLRKRRKIH